MQKPELEQDDGQPSSLEAKAALEKLYFQVYLKSKGLTEESLKSLPEKEANKIRREAALYASTKLAEQETRARFVQDLHRPKPGI